MDKGGGVKTLIHKMLMKKTFVFLTPPLCEQLVLTENVILRYHSRHDSVLF